MVSRGVLILSAALAFWSGAACATNGSKTTFRSQSQSLHHRLSISLEPTRHALEAFDTIQFPGSAKTYRISLHEGLKPHVTTACASMSLVGRKAYEELAVEEYDLTLAAGCEEVEIRYSGEIYHPLHEASNEASRGISETPGLISEEGVSLFGGTYWYPHVQGVDFFTFDLSVSAPKGWEAVSQGVRTEHGERGDRTISKWESPEPQQEIHLNAAVFHETTMKSDATDLMVFLRTPDAALAKRYLDATDRYLRMYVSLLGDYPYGKFALIENFWDTGYGMPSFTLIGSNVLRLPFIINSSYPHEILHVWWGNGVFVDDATGNWCEGLTSYLADHLLSEQAGNGVSYRRDSLEQFTSNVTAQNDFPLSEFKSRYNAATSAIGYGKAMMLFHMLRVRLGDEAYIRGMRRFYQDQLFKVAGYRDLRASFEASQPGLDLREFFDQWVAKKGAPELSVREARAEAIGTGFRLHLRLAQTQAGELFALDIPVAVHVKGQSNALQTKLTMAPGKGREQEFTIEVPAEPYRIEVDPEFDVFRRLSRAEVPPSFTRAYGAPRTIVVIPTSAAPSAQAAYRRFAEAIQKNQSGTFEIRKDNEIRSLADITGEATIWVMGWENRFSHEMKKGASEYGAKITNDSVELKGQLFKRAEHGFALTMTSSQDVKQTRVWLALDSQSSELAAPIMGTKLPHYGKFSFAAFEIGGATSSVTVANRASGQWPTVHSPLSVLVLQPGGGVLDLPKAQLAPRPALVAR